MTNLKGNIMGRRQRLEIFSFINLYKVEIMLEEDDPCTKKCCWHIMVDIIKIWHLLQPGAGTIRPEIISSLMTGGSEGGGGQTRLSIISSVALMMPARSGGSVREERIIMQRASSSCRTLSRYIMSKSLTIAPLITMISSPLMIPVKKLFCDVWVSK